MLGVPGMVVFGLSFMVPIAPFGVFGSVFAASGGQVVGAYLVGAAVMALTACSFVVKALEYAGVGSVHTFVGRAVGPVAGFLAGWMLPRLPARARTDCPRHRERAARGGGASIGHPLTVHGTGGQTRAFIHIRDTVRCIELAIANPPEAGAKPLVRNQITETHRVLDLAKMIGDMTDTEIAYLPNPRREAEENELCVRNDQFLALGLKPTTLSEGLLEEVTEVAAKYRHRADPAKIIARSVWRAGHGDLRGPAHRAARREVSPYACVAGVLGPRALDPAGDTSGHAGAGLLPCVCDHTAVCNSAGGPRHPCPRHPPGRGSGRGAGRAAGVLQRPADPC